MNDQPQIMRESGGKIFRKLQVGETLINGDQVFYGGKWNCFVIPYEGAQCVIADPENGGGMYPFGYYRREIQEVRK